MFFFQRKVSFFGFEISMEGISSERKKLENIINFKESKNKKQLQQFLGVCNYYRQFNVRHSSLVDSLRELLKKDIIYIEMDFSPFFSISKIRRRPE